MTAPVLCKDHRPVVAAMAEKIHTGEADVANAAAMFARCCLDCIPLQGLTRLAESLSEAGYGSFEACLISLSKALTGPVKRLSSRWPAA